VVLSFWVVLFSGSLLHASEITLLAPTNGSSVASKDVIIIGKAEQSVTDVEISGVAGENLKVKVKSGGFFAKVKLSGNDNNITIKANDGSSSTVNIKVGGTENFNYHPDDKEVLDCSSTCHTKVDSNGYVVSPATPVCYQCHDDNNGKAYVHGPVNMGVCGVCHTPHGSSIKGFLNARKETLCSSCHSTLMSTHPDQSSKLCVECHDPHSSDREFQMK